MKTFVEVSDFCSNFTYYNHYNVERVIELSHLRDYIMDFLSKCDPIDENLHKRVLGS